MPSQCTAGLTVEQLVALAQATGERQAFDRLFSLYDARLRAFLRAKVGRVEADDLLQEVYVKAYLRIRQFNGASQFSTWLFGIAVNEFLTARRKQKLLSRVMAFFWHDNSDAEQEAGHMESMVDLERSLRLLSGNQYETYALSRVFGYSHAEIAEELGMPLGSVKTYINQASKLLNQ